MIVCVLVWSCVLSVILCLMICGLFFITIMLGVFVCVCLMCLCVLCNVLCDVEWPVVFYTRFCLNECACGLCAMHCVMLYALACCALPCSCMLKDGFVFCG